jgi:hypothetical protein
LKNKRYTAAEGLYGRNSQTIKGETGNWKPKRETKRYEMWRARRWRRNGRPEIGEKENKLQIYADDERRSGIMSKILL